MTVLKPVVLLVDDTPFNLDFLLDNLEEANYHVIVAENGHSALERIQYVKPDIILLDAMMPDMDGFTTCRRLKADPATADIPVIFLTSLTDTTDKVRGFEAGGVDYITKPLQIEEVLARISTHLTIRQLQSELQGENERLEKRVAERTIALREEVEQRKRNEAEKSKLLDVVGRQSEQLREMTNWLIMSQKNHYANTVLVLREQVEQNLSMLTFHLQSLHSFYQGKLIQEQIYAHLTSALGLVEQTEKQLQSIVHNLHDPIETRHIAESPLLKLSTRESEVLRLVVSGKTNIEMADLLGLTETTIRTYRSRIMQKLNLTDLPSLTKFAIQHGLTTLQ